ncbi:MAG: hypothetical protein EOM61_09110 [Bacteroidia bacterium]|jgi:hypothetical protein|nr:hypothetical protein [Bacteroidia bacterium]
MAKTNLQKILSIAGQPGLYRFVAQANSGVVAESIITGKRNMFGMSARLTSLSDISIYTEEEEVQLLKVFEKMKEHLGDSNAPEAKSKPEVLKAFFDKVLPDYDRDRFYTSHMKKVVEWYNTLKQHESLDFEYPQEPGAQEEQSAE